MPRAHANPDVLPPPPGSLRTILEQVESHDGPIPVARLAQIYGVARKTIYAGIQKGSIPTIDVGLDRRIIDPKTLAFVLRQRNPVMSKAARS